MSTLAYIFWAVYAIGFILSLVDILFEPSKHSMKEYKEKFKKITSIKLPVKKISAYMPKDLPTADTEEYIIKALEFYKNNGAKEFEYEFEKD